MCGAASSTSARRRRRIVLRTTALPTFRLIAKATLGAEWVAFSTKTIRSGPLLPRPVGCKNSAKSRRVLTRPGTCELNGQAVAPLEAASLQDGTSGAGTHTGTKTVGFRSFTLVWLISTLHRILFSHCRAALRGTPWGSLERNSSILADLRGAPLGGVVHSV